MEKRLGFKINQKLCRYPCAFLVATFLVLNVSCKRDSDGDGVLDAKDNCAQTANPEQRDSDKDGKGDECDLVITPLGASIGSDTSQVDVKLSSWTGTRAVGLLAIFNGTSEPREWSLSVNSPVEWLRVPARGTVAGGQATTVSVDVVPDVLEPGKSATTTIVISLAGHQPQTVNMTVAKGALRQAGKCEYDVILKSITVAADQGVLDGALEILVDVNALGLGRRREPLAGFHVLRAGQAVRPNVIVANGMDSKGNAVRVTVVVDLDEIDMPPINPDDLRNQGQTGVANFNFVCDGRGSRIMVIPVTVFGNFPGEGNGLVEVEIEVSWDP